MNRDQLQAGLDALQEYLKETDKLDTISEGIIQTLFNAANELETDTAENE